MALGAAAAVAAGGGSEAGDRTLAVEIGADGMVESGLPEGWVEGGCTANRAHRPSLAKIVIFNLSAACAPAMASSSSARAAQARRDTIGTRTAPPFRNCNVQIVRCGPDAAGWKADPAANACHHAHCFHVAGGTAVRRHECAYPASAHCPPLVIGWRGSSECCEWHRHNTHTQQCTVEELRFAAGARMVFGVA